MDKAFKSLDDLERRLGKANKIAAKGDKMGYTDAIKLGRKSNSIVKSINTGIKENGAATPNDAESQKALKQMQDITALTETQLDLLVKNKPRFDELKVSGLVKKNMTKSETASRELSTLMLGKAPANLKSEAEQLEQRRATAFKKATAVYAGAAGGEDAAEGEDDSD